MILPLPNWCFPIQSPEVRMSMEEPPDPSTMKPTDSVSHKRTSIFQSGRWALFMLTVSLVLMLGLYGAYRSWKKAAGIDISVRASAIRFSVPTGSHILEDLSGEEMTFSGLNYIQCSGKAEQAITFGKGNDVLRAKTTPAPEPSDNSIRRGWVLQSAISIPDAPPDRSEPRKHDQHFITIAPDGVKSVQVLADKQAHAFLVELTRFGDSPPSSLQRSDGGISCPSSNSVQVSTRTIEIGSLLFRKQVASELPIERVVFTELDRWEKPTIEDGSVILLPSSRWFYRFEGTAGAPRKLQKGDVLTVTGATPCKSEGVDGCSLKLSVSVRENDPDLLDVSLQGEVSALRLTHGGQQDDLLPGALRWIIDSGRIGWVIVSCVFFVLGVEPTLVKWCRRMLLRSGASGLIGTFAVLSIVTAGSVRAQAVSAEEIRRAVVLVSGGTEEEGSGIVLDVRDSSSVWVITAAHVVMMQGKWRDSLSVHFYGDPFTACPAIGRAFGQGENEDLALLEIPRCKDARLPTFPVLTVRGDPHEGEVVWAIGHAGDNAFKATAPAAVTSGHLMRTGQVTVQADGRAAVLFRFDSQNIVSGFSGGPVLNERGELLGMTVERDKESGSATALKIETILNLLRSQFRFPKWSQLKIESGRPTDLEEVRSQLAMLQKRAEVVFSFFERRKQEIAKAGGHLRSEIESALVSASGNLRSATTALGAGQTTAVRRYMESAQASLIALESFR
jgi:hypothetical protein